MSYRELKGIALLGEKRSTIAMKKMISVIWVWPMVIVLGIIECTLKMLVKISTVAVGLGINVLLVCMLVAVCTQQWSSLGVLAVMALIGLLLVYGQATVLYLINEARGCLKL